GCCNRFRTKPPTLPMTRVVILHHSTREPPDQRDMAAGNKGNRRIVIVALGSHLPHVLSSSVLTSKVVELRCDRVKVNPTRVQRMLEREVRDPWTDELFNFPDRIAVNNHRSVCIDAAGGHSDERGEQPVVTD